MKIFLDCDGCVIDTTGALADYYNEHYHTEEWFIEADGDRISKWNAIDEMPLMNGKIEHIFESDFFWENVRLKKGAQQTIKHFVDDANEVYFLSIGSSTNIAKKTKFLKEHFPFVHRHIMLVQNKFLKMDKSIIDMSGGILIDDHINNLLTCNAEHKILFKDLGEKEWNQIPEGVTDIKVISSWYD